jgi:hypothetical protein
MEELDISELPNHYIMRLRMTHVKHDDLVNVYNSINKYDFYPDMLSMEDYIMAAHIKKYDFGDDLTTTGIPIEQAKKNVMWLAGQSLVMCHLIEFEARRTAWMN